MHRNLRVLQRCETGERECVGSGHTTQSLLVDVCCFAQVGEKGGALHSSKPMRRRFHGYTLQACALSKGNETEHG